MATLIRALFRRRRRTLTGAQVWDVSSVPGDPGGWSVGYLPAWSWPPDVYPERYRLDCDWHGDRWIGLALVGVAILIVGVMYRRRHRPV